MEYLEKKKFHYADYLADMAIYRMTKEEVEKRKLMIIDDKKKIAAYSKIVKSPAKIKGELIKELNEVGEKLDTILKAKEKAKKDVLKKVAKKKTRKRK